MEIALHKLHPCNYPQVILSSRTDGGVHALNSSAHIDLERPDDKIYASDSVVSTLNKFFFKNNISIFIKDLIRVNDNFNARHSALSRTYLYRLAVTKPGIDLPTQSSLLQHIPVEEWKRCYFIRRRGFDIERLKEGAKYFVGYHDFTTFKKFDKLTQHKHNRRMVYSIDVRESQPCVTGYSSSHQTCMEYWDIEIRGRSFVHNQIRRMVGTLIAVANGKIRPEDIKLMLQIPSKHSWHSFIEAIPPDGLYLCNVEYDPQDLIYNPERHNIEKTVNNEFIK
ncbi:tRNA pseudouridine synthase-like 1 isoform X2 [Leptidea sinapis]|nr:tRNA pseudouridine synthase-like 1 isoform X2 [Leptidea sinapis]